MKHQQVSVDYWTMFQTIFTYCLLSFLCWILLRLFHAVFTLPRRLQKQQETIQKTVKELQERFPDLNITEEDFKNLEKELDDFTNEGHEAEEEEEPDITTDKTELIKMEDENEDLIAECSKKGN